MNKTIQVTKKTYKLLEKGADVKGESMDKFIEELAFNNQEGVFFDVDKYDFCTKMAVVQDIFRSIKIESLSDKEKEELEFTYESIKPNLK